MPHLSLWQCRHALSVHCSKIRDPDTSSSYYGAKSLLLAAAAGDARLYVPGTYDYVLVTLFTDINFSHRNTAQLTVVVHLDMRTDVCMLYSHEHSAPCICCDVTINSHVRPVQYHTSAHDTKYFYISSKNCTIGRN